MIHEETLFFLLEGAIRVLEKSIQAGKKKISGDEVLWFETLERVCSARNTWESGRAEERFMIWGTFGLAHFLVTGHLPGNRSELTRSIRLFRRQRSPEGVLMRYLLNVFRLVREDVERNGLLF